MNPSEEVVLAHTATQLDVPSPNDDQLSVCLFVNSRKDSGIRSNSRRSSIQQQVLFHCSHAIVLILIFFSLFLFSFCRTAYYSFAGSPSHVCCHIHHYFLSFCIFITFFIFHFLFQFCLFILYATFVFLSSFLPSFVLHSSFSLYPSLLLIISLPVPY